MPSTDRKLELQAKTSVAQTGSQPFVYAKGFKDNFYGLRYNGEVFTINENSNKNMECEASE
jgi:hypothetical protein